MAYFYKNGHSSEYELMKSNWSNGLLRFFSVKKEKEMMLPVSLPSRVSRSLRFRPIP